ncbi:MAG: squalene/phytoene synthase family protein, partial [Pseudomonadota bacterium]
MITTSEYALDQAARQENFPVASRLLSPRFRGRVVAFYRYARLADDIADDPDMSAADKLNGLQALEDGLDGRGTPNVALALRETLDGTGSGDVVALAAARTLLTAFRRDAGGIVCADWADLMAYCDASAVPVGRFLLAIHGEEADTHAP